MKKYRVTIGVTVDVEAENADMAECNALEKLGIYGVSVLDTEELQPELFEEYCPIKNKTIFEGIY